MIAVVSGILSAVVLIAAATAIAYRLGYTRGRLDHEKFQRLWACITEETGIVDRVQQ